MIEQVAQDLADAQSQPHAEAPVSAHRDGFLVLGMHRTGVDFDAVDGRPVHILVGVLAPDGQASAHLKVLARISRLLRDPRLRERLLAAADPSEAHRCLIEMDERLSAI